MTKPIIKIHNTQTDEIIEREMTDAEFENYLAREEHFANKNNQLLEAQAKRQALLDKLGITEEEARLLLGGN